MNKLTTDCLKDIKLWLGYYFPHVLSSNFHSNIINSDRFFYPRSIYTPKPFSTPKVSDSILQFFNNLPPGESRTIVVPYSLLKEDPKFFRHEWIVLKEWLDCTELERISLFDFNKLLEWSKRHGIYCHDLSPNENQVKFGGFKQLEINNKK